MSFNENKKIYDLLNNTLQYEDEEFVVSFNQLLQKVSKDPVVVFRNIFQLFNNMIHYYTKEFDEYKNDPENINYKTINCDKLLVNGTDTPFFADLPLANRIIKLADSFKEGSQQNKVYVFIGPPGSGKSTFITNLLLRFQEYTRLHSGVYYETLWRMDNEKIGSYLQSELKNVLEDYWENEGMMNVKSPGTVFDIPCPSHDHPILILPKDARIKLLEKLIPENLKDKIFHKKEYEWVFKGTPCTICMSIYEALLDRLKSPAEVLNSLYARRYCFNRRLGNGVTVFNPGDEDPKNMVFGNKELQREIGQRFKDSNIIRYVYSRYARTNNGVFVIMDVKGNNVKRFFDLHGVISEGLHKINDYEENVNSLFIAVMNPEDKEKIKGYDSFKDRITEINVNYILNFAEEVKIYFNSFGTQIKKNFLPGVLDNFAKIIISSRLNPSSKTINNWIDDSKKYIKYCDENLLLLKMGIYSNSIPSWLTEDDLKKLDKITRKAIIDESEKEGRAGFSGRESINIFNDFYSTIRSKEPTNKGRIKIKSPITMKIVKDFFEKNEKYKSKIPKGFIDSLIRLYDYNIMQEIKVSLFQENEERIRNDIKNYLFAINYEVGETKICPYTNEKIEISEIYFQQIEQNLFPIEIAANKKIKMREGIANSFAISLQKVHSNSDDIDSSETFKDLYNQYMARLRNNIFLPFVKYAAYENAIKDYGTDKFQIYDDKTKEQVEYLIKNLKKKFKYSINGAKTVCLYAIENKIAEKY